MEVVKQRERSSAGRNSGRMQWQSEEGAQKLVLLVEKRKSGGWLGGERKKEGEREPCTESTVCMFQVIPGGAAGLGLAWAWASDRERTNERKSDGHGAVQWRAVQSSAVQCGCEQNGGGVGAAVRLLKAVGAVGSTNRRGGD